MPTDTYYRDHWIDIDEERLDTYEGMFEWHPRMAPLLVPAELQAGLRVLDYGCGPGGLSVEIGRQVGASGAVIGVDLNTDMVARAQARALKDGLANTVTFQQSSDARLPFPDDSFDRVICKSVLEYVSDPGEVLAEFHRVTRPGGKVHVIDSDWGMLVAEPIADSVLDELFSAASMAYKTPRIGRKLYGLFRAAGFTDIAVKILSAADTTGVRAPIIRHMVGYARDFEALPSEQLDAVLATIEAAIDKGNYILVLPQFLVTGQVE